MWFSSWLQKRTISRKHRPASRFRPVLEVLEDRAVPATFTVNTTLDVLGHDNGMLSLRQAIMDANAAPGADTIVVPAGTYTLTRAEATEDGGLTGDLEINDSLTISGAGAGATVIDGGGIDRVFQIDSGTVTLSGLTLQGGNETGPSSNGGAIANLATLTVSDSIISGNTAEGDGGGIHNAPGGSLTVNNSTLSGNSAGTFGGGIGGQGTLTIINSTLSANSASDGGGISIQGGSVTVDHSTLSTNTAKNLGGGIYSLGTTLTVNNSTLSANFADRGGGGIYGNHTTLTVSSCAFAGNGANTGIGEGGGIDAFYGTLTINHNSSFTGNSASKGGGIFRYSYTFQTLTISDSTFSDNHAYQGGGIYDYAGTGTVSSSTFSGNGGSYGGGIYSYGTLTVSSSTFTGNTAWVNGGGIYNRGKLTLQGSTLLTNSAPVGADLYNLGTLSLFNDTIGVIGP
jgi:predicted outer membrane repeat protein